MPNPKAPHCQLKSCHFDPHLRLRLRPDTLAGLKSKAKEVGMPYQTLVTNLLHQFVTGKITLTL